MNIQPQNSKEYDRLGNLIEDFSIAMLSFRDSSGALISQPMGPIEMDADGGEQGLFIGEHYTADKLRIQDLELQIADLKHQLNNSKTPN